MKVLALDYGSARTGVAVSDPTGTIARPLGVVERAATEAGPRAARRARARARSRARRRRPAADAARRARRAGARDGGVRRSAARSRRGPGRELRRALHDRPRRAASAPATHPRTRAPPPICCRATSRGRAPAGSDAAAAAAAAAHSEGGGLAAALVALGVLLGGLACVAWFAVDSVGGGDDTKSTTDVTCGRRRRRSGSSSRKASRASRWRQRVAAVAGIARTKARQEGEARVGRVPGRDDDARAPELGFGRRPLEGFLFPATYDFTRAHDLRAARGQSSSRPSGVTGRRSTSRTRARRT